MTTAQAKKWECSLRRSTLCSRGAGTPTRKRCGYCGGTIRTDVGIWGVFTWRGDGRYPLGSALATFASELRAQRDANTRGENSVVRFIYV